jgi:hypothetical protein
VGHRRLRGDASENPRRVKLLSLTPIGPADGGLRLFGHRPFRRLTARLQGPKLCLSPQPHRVRHELRPPALATPARRPGGLPIASSTRAPRSGVPSAKCIVGSASAAFYAITTDTPLSAVPSRQACRTAWGTGLSGRAGSPLAVAGPSLYDGFPAAPLQPNSFTHATRQYTFFILLSLRSSFLTIRRHRRAGGRLANRWA